jgi:hypothetical protein
MNNNIHKKTTQNNYDDSLFDLLENIYNTDTKINTDDVLIKSHLKNSKKTINVYTGIYGTIDLQSGEYFLVPGMINSKLSSGIPIYFNKTTLINSSSITINGSDFSSGTVYYNIYRNNAIINTIQRGITGTYTDNSKSFRYTTQDSFYAGITGSNNGIITSIITSFTTY